MPVIAKILGAFGYVKISNYGLRLQPDDHIAALHQLPAASPHTQIVGWKPGNEPVAALPHFSTTLLAAPTAQPSLVHSMLGPKPAVVSPIASPAPATISPLPRAASVAGEDEEDDWQWQMIIARARANETGSTAPVVSTDPTVRQVPLPVVATAVTTTGTARPQRHPTIPPTWVLPTRRDEEFAASEQVTFNGKIDTAQVPARPSAAHTVEYAASSAQTTPTGTPAVAAQYASRPHMTRQPKATSSAKSTMVVAVVPPTSGSAETRRTVIAVPTLPTTNGVAIREASIGPRGSQGTMPVDNAANGRHSGTISGISGTPRPRPAPQNKPGPHDGVNQRTLGSGAHAGVNQRTMGNGIEENTLVDMVVAAAIRL